MHRSAGPAGEGVVDLAGDAAGDAAGDGSGAAPWLRPYAGRLAALLALEPARRLARLNDWALTAGARSGSGRALRFVAAPQAGGPQAGRARAAERLAYEQRVFEHGEVATRVQPPGDRHDLYNALAWIEFPLAKARLNALHRCAGSAAADGAARGPLRDALTLFDENGALWLSCDRMLTDALACFDWHGLFVGRRAQVAQGVAVRVFGHALLEKLDAPYKGITAHAWPLPLPPDTAPAAVDRALADSLHPGRLHPRTFCPLPVLGLPGWCEANRDPAFYNDCSVFRPGRMRAAPATHPHRD